MILIDHTVLLSGSAFLLLAAAAVSAKCLKAGVYAVLKPLPVLFLAGFLFWSLKGNYGWPLLVCAGLCLGAAGDVLLLNPARFFIPSLCAFLFGHLAYATAFLTGAEVFYSAALMLVLPCGVWFSSFRRKMADDTRKKYLPALLGYLAVLVVMGSAALSFDYVRASFPFFSLGAGLFCVSDALLARVLFVRRTVFLDVFVSVSYYAAQAFIAAGVWYYLAVKLN
jgi:uncharacterized membrane protein YhhN